MPSGTKQAIIDSFLYLAGKKSPDKITVRDIVDDCGVNRNTFYYYFQDIYAVMETLCADTVESLPKDAPLPITMGEFYRKILSFTAAHPAAARSLALTLGFEGLERYFGASLDRLIGVCLTREQSTPPAPIQPRLVRHAVLGLALDVMRQGKTPLPTPEELIACFPTSPLTSDDGKEHL